jgi:hypothetical protein
VILYRAVAGVKMEKETIARAFCRLLAAFAFGVQVCAAQTALPNKSLLLPAPEAQGTHRPLLIAETPFDEFLGPFPSWLDVKRDFGAAGDGISDDTDAIQRGLNALCKLACYSPNSVTLYFPAGKYRITRTLLMELNHGANVIGEDPSKTSIFWAGQNGGTMLRTSGSMGTTFGRLTWDGSGTAAIGIAQWWNYRVDRANYQGSIEHVDEIFRDVDIGIFGGRLGIDYGQGDSETLILRNQFISNRVAGVNLGSFNALNWWIWDSKFVDCGRGVSNEFSFNDSGRTTGAGTFMVYRSEFLRSKFADLGISNTGWFSIHESRSQGSRRFIQANSVGANAGAFLVQGNFVSDTQEDEAILFGNEGPLFLVDNRFQRRAKSDTPIVEMIGSGVSSNHGDRDAISIGNTYPTSGAIRFSGEGGRLISFQDQISNSDIAWAERVIEVAPNFHRRIFEVPDNASAADIQRSIDAASAAGSDNAVVHIPAGTYRMDRTLTVPANTRIQISGDSFATSLWWNGNSRSGPMIKLAGPSKATLRNLTLVGKDVTAIQIEKANQIGGRILIEGSRMGKLVANGLAETAMSLLANPGFAGISLESSSSFAAIGVGGWARSDFHGGAAVLIGDSWYEGDQSNLFDIMDTNFTYLGGVIAPFSHGVGQGESSTSPAIWLRQPNVNASFIGLGMDLPKPQNGILISGSARDSSVAFIGVSANKKDYFRTDKSASGSAELVMGKLSETDKGTYDIADETDGNPGTLVGAFDLARSLVWTQEGAARQGSSATEVRIIRVSTEDTSIGLSAAQ